jgi:hypothetical protein
MKRTFLSVSGCSLFAGCLALALTTQVAPGRLYDNFNSGANWTLSDNGGTAVIASSELTLTSPAGVLSTPTATLNAAQAVTGTRQSILVRSHTGVANATVFFLWATDTATGNRLELKLDDINPTTVVAGYYSGGGGTYNYVGSAAYSPGSDGLYMAFRESGGTTYWEISTDADTWTEVASASDPVSTSSMSFEVQHKAYVATSEATATVVDCFNYKATGAGYSNLESKTYTGSDGWYLYTEGYNAAGTQVCNDNCNMSVNGVDSSQHFTDTTIPTPRSDDTGYDFRIISTDAPTSRTYYNAYRYQQLAFVDADNWTYHLYFKYAYPQYITQGLEFPLNKYTGSYRLQGAVAWYPNRPDNGSHTGVWHIWSGTNWTSIGSSQAFTPGQWYEVTFNVGLHDNYVYYSSFQAGPASSMTTFTWNYSYAARSSTAASYIIPAMQIDDNIDDTTTADTQKDCYMAQWNIGWTDERLP